MNEDNKTTTSDINDKTGVKAVKSKTDDDGWKRNEDGTFAEGNKGGGQQKQTEEEKLKKKAQKELIAEFKQSMIEALQEVSPVLKQKALEGDMTAIKEINDRAMGKPKQPLTGGDENDEPLVVNIIRNGNNDPS